MGIAFSRTTRALNADRGAGSKVLIIAALILIAAWAAWFIFGRVTVYQVSRAAHIEVASSSREITALPGGRLIASGLFIGRRVKAGDVLAELDSQEAKLRLAEAEARLAGYPERLAALHRAQSSSSQARAGTEIAGSAELSAARARTREAQTSADFNRGAADRQKADAESGGSAQIDADRAAAEARRAASAAEAMRHDETRIAGDSSARRADREADSARLSASIATEESNRAALEQEVAQLRYELESRKIRAPGDGVIGEVMAVKLGEVLAAGQRLATIIPDGTLHVVAAFDPATGLGRLTTGQTARLRLDGFSWAQYGDFPATVERVAGEANGNMLRVELLMPRREHEELPLRHGMTGHVDVAIEQVSPAVLVLRAIGQIFA